VLGVTTVVPMMAADAFVIAMINRKHDVAVDGDWVQQERDHEYRVMKLNSDERQRRRVEITERVTAVCVVFGIVGSLAVLAALIYFWQHDSGGRGHQVEVACVAAGGTWTSLGGGSKVCIHINQESQ
jgi:hypothetical protein